MTATSGRQVWLAHAGLVVVVLVWGTTFVVVKSALRDASTLLFLAIRFSLASLALAIVFRKECTSWRSLRQGLKGGSIAGLLLFFSYFFQTVGLRYTTASKSAFITALSIVAVPLIAAFVYKNVPQATELAGVAVAAAGLGLMTFESAGFQMNFGDWMTGLCALSFAAQVVVVGHYSTQVGIGVLSFTQVGLIALISLGSFSWAETPRVVWSPGLLIALVVTALLATALAFPVQAWAQRYVSPTRTALILALEPVFAAIVAYIWASERLSLKAMSGGALIVAGVVLAELKPARGERHP
jgi:drug/metabolite transporter (DMT)-like permease